MLVFKPVYDIYGDLLVDNGIDISIWLKRSGRVSCGAFLYDVNHECARGTCSIATRAHYTGLGATEHLDPES